MIAYSDNLVTVTLFPCPEGATVSGDLCILKLEDSSSLGSFDCISLLPQLHGHHRRMKSVETSIYTVLIGYYAATFTFRFRDMSNLKKMVMGSVNLCMRAQGMKP